MNNLVFNKSYKLFFWAIIVLLSRIPFLNAGYGVEEDSWGIAVAAYHTQLYGIMEASRLPGHPVNEFVYSVFWGHGAWLFNFFSALCSVVCFILFYLILKKFEIKNALLAAMALVFTPVVYINSTCTIDYLWALMFCLGAFYYLVHSRLFLAGVFLGLAVGCRINSAILYLPFLIWLFYEHQKQFKLKEFFLFSISFGFVTLLCFVPIVQVYGWQFFSYSDQFPYPSLPKIIYKASIGVVGLPAMLVIIWVVIYKKNWGFNFKNFNATQMLFLSLLILQIWAYLMLPQKSAYLMLLVPFGILYLSQTINAKPFVFVCFALIASSFFMSINLTDDLRGAQYSKWAIKNTIAQQEIFLDPFTGPVYNDYTKRINKLNYTSKVIEKLEKLNYPSVTICGWWFNQILIQQMYRPKIGMHKFAFYLSPELMENYSAKGYQIYYLSEQEIYNDLFYGFNRTKNIANPFLLGNEN